MPVTLDIKTDYRYNQGLKAGKLEMATQMLKKGISVDSVKVISGLPEQEIKELAHSLKSGS